MTAPRRPPLTRPVLAGAVALPGLVVAVVIGVSGITAMFTARPLLLNSDDTALPTATDLIDREVDDLARDVMNLTNHGPRAPEELADDLARLSPPGQATVEAIELAGSISTAVAGRMLADEDAQRVARALWLAVRPWDPNGRPLESWHVELHAILVRAGVAEDAASWVIGQLGETQKAVTAGQNVGGDVR